MNRGGAEVMIMDIFKNLSEDFKVDFLINYKLKNGIIKGDLDEQIQSLGGKIYHIASQWDLGPLQYIKKFKEIILENGIPDIAHIHMNAKSGIIAFAAKKAGIKKVIVHSHANLKFRGSIISRIISNIEFVFQKILIAKYADYYWGCSQEANNSLFYRFLLKKENSAIINNAVDTESYQNVSQSSIDRLRNSYRANKNTLIIGNIGRIVRHKNVYYIIEILKELKNKGIDFRFVFAGRADQPEYLEEIMTTTEEYGLNEKVIYLGLRDDIPEVMNTFDVFVGPALKEGFGLVALEAQAAGVPCILYTGFPSSVDMQLNLVAFLDSFQVDHWVNAILEMKTLKSHNQALIREKISELGFDSVSNSETVGKLYKKIKDF